MIKRLVLLPGMHGTRELFSEFLRMMPEPTQIDAPCYPTDASPSYNQLQATVEFFAPASEDFVLLAESFSTPLAIQYAATNPPKLKARTSSFSASHSDVRRLLRDFSTVWTALQTDKRQLPCDTIQR
jgi:hypothetical protein